MLYCISILTGVWVEMCDTVISSALGVMALFLCTSSYMLAEMIQCVPFPLSRWSQTFLTCVLVLWLLLDNIIFSIDLCAALSVQRRLTDDVALLEYKLLVLENAKNRINRLDQTHEEDGVFSL